jgi:hypothetical protein
MENPVAEFIALDWGDKINSGIELSYLPATWASGPARKPYSVYAGVNFIPQSGIYEFGYCTSRMHNS